jgi:hypothetical protein
MSYTEFIFVSVTGFEWMGEFYRSGSNKKLSRSIHYGVQIRISLSANKCDRVNWFSCCIEHT